MGISSERFKDWIRYTPDVMGNLDSPETNPPTSMLIRPLSHREMKSWRMSFVTGGKRKKRQTAAEARAELEKAEGKVAEIMTERVKDIQNLRWEGVDITTGEELAESGPEDLVADTFEALTNISHLTANLKNVSSLESASGQVGTKPQDGAANDVEGPQTTEG